MNIKINMEASDYKRKKELPLQAKMNIFRFDTNHSIIGKKQHILSKSCGNRNTAKLRNRPVPIIYNKTQPSSPRASEFNISLRPLSSVNTPVFRLEEDVPTKTAKNFPARGYQRFFNKNRLQLGHISNAHGRPVHGVVVPKVHKTLKLDCLANKIHNS